MLPSRIRIALLNATLLLAPAAAAHAQLDPNAFSSLGTLNITSGTLTINTDTLAMSGAAAFTGVSIAQADGPQVAVFDFGSITIGSGVTVNITGSQALALLARGDATVQTTLSVTSSTIIPIAGNYIGGSATLESLASVPTSIEVGQGELGLAAGERCPLSSPICPSAAVGMAAGAGRR